jgi:hypothetical protein
LILVYNSGIKKKGDNKMDIVQKMVSIMQAYSGGKIVEQKAKVSGAKWIKVDSPSWNWDKNDYRIADQTKYELSALIENDSSYHVMTVRKSLGSNGSEYVRFPRYFLDMIKERLIVDGNAKFAIIGLNDIAKSIVLDLDEAKIESYKNTGTR